MSAKKGASRTTAELLAERRALGLTAADLPWSPGVYAEDLNLDSGDPRD